jgi:hypothetical protein
MKFNTKIHNIKLKKLLDEIKVEESSNLVKEFSLDPLEITAVALSAPDVARVTADGIDFISKEIGTGDKTKTAELLRTGADKLHKFYINDIMRMLNVGVPGFNEVPMDKKQKIANSVFAVIITSIGFHVAMDAPGLFAAFMRLKNIWWDSNIREKIKNILYSIKFGNLGAFFKKELDTILANK